MMLIPRILSLLSVATFASAAKLTVSISPAPPVLPNPATLPPSTHATLIGAPGNKISAPLRRDNTFIFDNLPEDSYLLSIHSRDHFFPPYRVDVGHAENNTAQEIVHVWQTFRGNEWSNKGPLLGSAQDELRIDVRPAATKEYYQQRGGFNLLGFLKSPMILMGLFSVVMIFGMPYLMDNSEALIARALLLKAVLDFRTDCMQWTRRRRQSSKRCRRIARSLDRVVQRTRSKTSILRASCLASRAMVVEVQLGMGRSDELRRLYHEMQALSHQLSYHACSHALLLLLCLHSLFLGSQASNHFRPSSDVSQVEPASREGSTHANSCLQHREDS